MFLMCMPADAFNGFKISVITLFLCNMVSILCQRAQVCLSRLGLVEMNHDCFGSIPKALSNAQSTEALHEHKPPVSFSFHSCKMCIINPCQGHILAIELSCCSLACFLSRIMVPHFYGPWGPHRPLLGTNMDNSIRLHTLTAAYHSKECQ